VIVEAVITTQLSESAAPPPGPRLDVGSDTYLRDVLAIDRTILANERTLLSYFRTMLALLAAGVGLIQFVEASWAVTLGVVSMVSGPLLFAAGVWRYRRVNRDLRRVRDQGADR
jgi:putative membrane protein